MPKSTALMAAAVSVSLFGVGQARAGAILNGSLLQSTYSTGTTINLTAAGGIAWKQFAPGNSFGSGIGSLTALGGASRSTYSNELYQTAWSNSTTTPTTGTSTTAYYYSGGTNPGVSFTVTASSTTEEMLTLIVGGYLGADPKDKLTATLDGLSYSTTFTATSNYDSAVYQIVFEGANPGDTLNIAWVSQNGGNADLIAAAIKPVPEPISLAVLGTGFLGLALARRRAAPAAG